MKTQQRTQLRRSGYHVATHLFIPVYASHSISLIELPTPTKVVYTSHAPSNSIRNTPYFKKEISSHLFSPDLPYRSAIHPMCELRPFKCAVCGARWLAQTKLASCKSDEAGVKCPDRLCMYVGNPKWPQSRICGGCQRTRLVGERSVERSGF